MSVAAAILGSMTTRSLPDIARLAGIITAAELRASGVTRSRLRTLVHRGELTRLERGVYAAGDELARAARFGFGKQELHAVAVLAALQPGSVASHYTAAALHGLDLLCRPPLLTITRPPGAGSRSGKPGVLVHSATLPDHHVCLRAAVPVTTVARTVIDLARTSSFREGVVVADSALHQSLTSKKQLRALLAEFRRWRGVQRAAEVVEFADRRSESVLESIARVAFAEHGLPPPDLQVDVRGDGFIGRVDFMWPEFVTIAEVDGAMKYDDRSAAMKQLRRDARLRDAGYEVVHFNWQEITAEPGRVAASIRAAFERGRRAQ
jgi:predicted transcriptional regulator of viral defense system